MRKLATVLIPYLLLCCGDAPEAKIKFPEPSAASSNPGSNQQSITAANYTPGYFRDVYRMLDAATALENAAAAEQLLIESRFRLSNPGELPNLSSDELLTLNALLTLCVRSIQATRALPATANILGSELLSRSLGLDPALDALINEGGQADTLTGGAQAIAEAAQWTLRQAAQDYPSLCSNESFLTDSDENPDAFWEPGNAEIAWVEGYCEEDRWLGDYCEPDRWIEGRCYEEYIQDNCSGEYVDYGYYEYYCYSSDDCQYIWRSDLVYEEGSCDGGYYQEYCDNGYWEYGICYEGSFEPGYCDPGHYEYRYPGGTWVFSNYATAPVGCEGIRPSQYAIGVSAVEVLAAYGYEELDGRWKSAIDALLNQAPVDEPNEATFAAINQIIDAVAAGDAQYQQE